MLYSRTRMATVSVKGLRAMDAGCKRYTACVAWSPAIVSVIVR